MLFRSAILSCTSTYPTPFTDIHLNTIQTYKSRFRNHRIGYSGHETGYIPTLGAVAKGATIIERHITLDKNMRGSDHRGSLEPHELMEMVTAIRILEQSMGSPEKRIRASEKPFMEKLTKSYCTTTMIPRGTVITEDMITTKHPGTGIIPIRTIIGYRVIDDIPADTIIMPSDLMK